MDIPKAVIFDCDGTLVDSEEVHFLGWRHAFAQYGYDLSAEDYTRQFAGRGESAVAVKANGLTGRECAQQIIRLKSDFFHQAQGKGIPSIAPTIELLRRLAEARGTLGFKLAVASGAGKEEILRNLRHHQIEHFFDVILSGADDLAEYADPEGTNKPKPYVYLKTAMLLGCRAEECIAIEDSSPGVAAAVAAGCRTIAIPNRYTKGQDFSRAHLLVETFAGLELSDFFNHYKELKHDSISSSF